MPIEAPSQNPREDFEEIPVLKWTDYTDERKKEPFLAQLRHVLLNVGFMYVIGHPIPPRLLEEVKKYTIKAFDLPLSAKLEIEMAKSPKFLVDHREQFDIGLDVLEQYSPGKKEFYKLRGKGQWPDESLIPGFKATISEYLHEMGSWSLSFSGAVEEALHLKPGALTGLYGKQNDEVGRIKMVKYPAVSHATDGDNQGVGPHKDGWLTYLLMCDDVPGLEVQNAAGKWIPVRLLEGSFVVNIGFWLESVTRGAAIATTHRVLNPPPESPARYSVPFFQSLALEARVAPLPEEDLPDEVLAIAKRKVVSEADSMQSWARVMLSAITNAITPSSMTGENVSGAMQTPPVTDVDPPSPQQIPNGLQTTTMDNATLETRIPSEGSNKFWTEAPVESLSPSVHGSPAGRSNSDSKEVSPPGQTVLPLNTDEPTATTAPVVEGTHSLSPLDARGPISASSEKEIFKRHDDLQQSIIEHTGQRVGALVRYGDREIGPGVGYSYSKEVAQLFKDETNNRTELLSRKLDEIRQGLDEQMEVERRHYEDLLDRQISDIVVLEQRERKLNNEVSFLRARLERAIRERDRAAEIEHSQRERDLEDRLKRQDSVLSQHNERVGALQEALGRTLARIDTEVSRKERDERKRAEQSIRDLEENFEENLDRERRAWNKEKTGLLRELDDLKKSKKRFEDAENALGTFRRRVKQLEGELDRAKLEAAKRRRNEEVLIAKMEGFEEKARQWSEKERELRELEFLRLNYNRLRDLDRQHVNKLNRLQGEVDRLRRPLGGTSSNTAPPSEVEVTGSSAIRSGGQTLARPRSEELRRGAFESRKEVPSDFRATEERDERLPIQPVVIRERREKVSYMEESARAPVYTMAKEE
ncbi:hypothetical protein HDU93_007960 [Gonapodya sp. JEL0774]|nr:hypothetical protein HDU93_007960 [Gonapodya sp. JEL0774]